METASVEELLTINGLGKYVPSFRFHAVDTDVLFDITHEDLEEMGIQSLGHRIQILKMIDTRRPLSSAVYAPMQRPQLATIVPPARNSPATTATASTLTETTLTSGTAVANSGSSVASLSSHESLGLRETVILRERLENSEKHIRKLSEQISRLRADLFRKFKESEPLPTPTGRNYSPGSTPGLASAHSKRSPSDSYFQQRHSHSPGSAVVSPTGGVPPSSSSSHVFHGHWSGTPSGLSSTANSYFQSPSNSGTGGSSGGSGGGGGTSSHGLTPLPQAIPPNQSTASLTNKNSSASATSNLLISNPSDSFKNIRCTEKDNVHKVMSAFQQRKYLEGDLSQWRLQVQYGDKSRELLDHEYPLVVFKQLQDQGYRPIFNMKQTQPHKPPDGTYI